MGSLLSSNCHCKEMEGSEGKERRARHACEKSRCNASHGTVATCPIPE